MSGAGVVIGLAGVGLACFAGRFIFTLFRQIEWEESGPERDAAGDDLSAPLPGHNLLCIERQSPKENSLQPTGSGEEAPSMANSPAIQCAWCHPEDRRPGVSHGICDRHKAQMLAEWQNHFGGK